MGRCKEVNMTALSWASIMLIITLTVVGCASPNPGIAPPQARIMGALTRHLRPKILTRHRGLGPIRLGSITREIGS